MSIEEMASRSCFHDFPNEILYEIFDYLSNNDLVFGLFNINERMNELILNNRRYLSYFCYSSMDLNKWINVFEKISSRIECLNVLSDDLFYSLNDFSNFRSLILCSIYGFIPEELSLMINSNQFKYLKTFQIRKDRENVNRKDNNLLEQIWNNGNQLEELILPTFNRINIEYLNIDSSIPHVMDDQISMKSINVKLKEFSLTFYHKIGRLNDIHWKNSFHEIINGVNLFSSSLISLSFYLINLPPMK